MDELARSIDALSRDQLFLLVQRLGLQGLQLPVLLPGGCGTVVGGCGGGRVTVGVVLWWEGDSAGVVVGLVAGVVVRAGLVWP